MVVDAEAVAPVDWVLLAVKAHQTDGAAGWLDALCGGATTVAVLQNGIDHVERVAPLAGAATVLPTVNWCPVEPADGGYRQRGPLRLMAPVGGEGLGDLFGGEAEVEIRDDFLSAAWKKLCANAVAGILAVTERRTEVLLEPDIRALADTMAVECAAVARAEGAALSDDRAREIVAGLAADAARLEHVDPRRPRGRAPVGVGSPQRGGRPDRASPRHRDARVRRPRRAAPRRQRLAPSTPDANMCSCAGTTSRSTPRSGRRCPAIATRPRSATSTRPRHSTPGSTRSARSPRSTACPRSPACRSAGRSTRTGDAPMRALTAPGATRRSLWPTAARDRSREVRKWRPDLRHARRGPYRRYVTTEVLDHWSTVKPAFRITLADGTELITSGDHRFLTEPWLEARHGAGRPRSARSSRPNNALMGTGGVRQGPLKDDDYCRGYLCGMVRGDGTLGTYALHTPERRSRRRPRLPPRARRRRGARTDAPLPRRARCPRDEFAFRRGHGDHARGDGDPHRSRRAVWSAIRALDHAGPVAPNEQWRSGFLAGHLRRGGLVQPRRLRIANADPEILALDRDVPAAASGFDTVSSDARQPTAAHRPRPRWAAASGCASSTSPIRRSPASATIEGMALKSDADLGVVSIEPLGIDAAAVRHHHRHRRLHRQRRGQPQLLRAPHPQVPRHGRRPRLRAADRRQGQRARGAARPSSRGRRGRASTSRWARTPTRTSGSRGATS